MYLHIGKNKIVDIKDIIGIFNIELKKTKEFNKILENLKEKNNLIDVSDSIEKSLILIKEKDIVKGYLSNISPLTLAKRTEDHIY